MEIKTLLKRKDILVIIVLLFLTFIISKNVFQKKMNEANTIREAIREQEKVNGILVEMKAIEKKSNDLKNKFPQQETNSLINKISELAQNAGVKITSIQPVLDRDEREAKEKNYIEIPFTLSLEATYHEIGKFLNRLETADIFFKINKLEFGEESYRGKILPKESIKNSARIVVLTIFVKS